MERKVWLGTDEQMVIIIPVNNYYTHAILHSSAYNYNIAFQCI